MLSRIALPHQTGPTVGMLDGKIVIIKHERKLGAQEGIEFRRRHSRRCHH